MTRDHRKYQRPKQGCSRPNCPNLADYYATRGLCRKHNRGYLRELKAQGQWEFGRIPTKDVIAHLDMLKQLGFGHRKIAELSGIAECTVGNIRRQKTIQKFTADKLFAIHPRRPFDDVAPHAVIASFGTTRRLRALVAIGWSQAELARRLGTTETVLYRLTCGKKPSALAKTAQSVDGLYQELHLTPGGSKKALNRAAKLGWHPPMAWEEDRLDDPSAEPFVGMKELNRDAFEANYFDALGLGLPDERAIADRLGMSLEALRKRVGRMAA